MTNFEELRGEIAELYEFANRASPHVQTSLRSQIHRLEQEASAEQLESVTAALGELQAEQSELKEMAEHARSAKVRRLLNSEIVSRTAIVNKLEFERTSIENRKRNATQGSDGAPATAVPTPVAVAPVSAPAAAAAAPVPVGEGVPTDEEIASLKFELIKTFAWDQTPKFAKVYITLAGVTPQTRVRGNFTSTRADVYAVGVNGKNFHFIVAPLCERVKPAECDVAAKDGRLFIRLRKEAEEDWSGLDDTEKRKKEQHQRLVKTGATTEELLANMYAQADDETRASLAKAAAEGQRKRVELRAKDSL